MEVNNGTLLMDVGEPKSENEHGDNYNIGKYPYYWRDVGYFKLSEISAALAAALATASATAAEDIIEMLKSGYLSLKLASTLANPDEATMNTLREVEEMTSDYPGLGSRCFMYRFSTVTNRGKMDPDKLFMEMTMKADDWYKKARELLSDDDRLARLYATGCGKDDIYLLKQATGKFISDGAHSDLTLLYLFFDALCYDKYAVRDHFLKYGPQSYLYWWRQNLELYSFDSLAAHEIKNKILHVTVNNSMPVSELSLKFMSLKQYLDDFMLLFQDNYLMDFLGISMNNEDNSIKSITTHNTYGYFAEDFYGIRVPVGYRRSV